MKFKKIKEIVLFGVINLLFISSALLFISTVYDVQISNSEYFQNQALSYREKVEILEAARGSIYDRNLKSNIFKIIKRVNWKHGFFRKDIGWRVIKKIYANN